MFPNKQNQTRKFIVPEQDTKLFLIKVHEYQPNCLSYPANMHTNRQMWTKHISPDSGRGKYTVSL